MYWFVQYRIIRLTVMENHLIEVLIKRDERRMFKFSYNSDREEATRLQKLSWCISFRQIRAYLTAEHECDHSILLHRYLNFSRTKCCNERHI